MPILPGIISNTTNCLFSYQPLVIWELRVGGWPELKVDGKCCLKWIRKAAGFIFTHSVTCAAKRKQVTEECVLKPKLNTQAQMICCHLGRSAFSKPYFAYLPDLVPVGISFFICPLVDGLFTVTLQKKWHFNVEIIVVKRGTGWPKDTKMPHSEAHLNATLDKNIW